MSFFLLSFFFLFHDYHATITEVRHNHKKQTLEVIIRAYTDDFELALKRKAGKKIKVDETKAHHELISEYVLAHFQIKNNKKQLLTGTYIGKKMDIDMVELYVEFPAKGFTANKWSLSNSMITEVYDDQTNIVNFFYLDDSSARKTMAFTRNAPFEILP
jgi:hypothetical protein